MEIVIHGTKGGRKIFTSNKLAGLFDVTSDSPKTSAIGQSSYAIRFIINATIFSKYKIIRDVRGDKRTGFVAFSIFISKNEKLSGTDIINFLDKVSEEYCKKYIIDNNLNEVNEDWTFVELLSNEYKNKLREVSIEESENIQSDILDEAFIYYTETELQKYFEQPYQEKYIPYRQIFFISDTLKNTPGNPLNALRNSGKELTGEIDLENPPLILRDFNGFGNNDTSITIKKSDSTILEKGSKVYRNDILTVIYSKKYYFHEPIEGNLDNDKVKMYLKIRDENKIDVERNFTSFKPLEKTIELDIVKKDGTEVLNPLITCKSSHQPPIEILNKKAIFIGEQLNGKWEVSVRDNEYEGHISIFPEEKNTEKIILTRKKHVKIKILDEKGGKIIYKYKVFCQNHRDNNQTLSAIDFIDDEIKKNWDIHIYGNSDYQVSESRKFCPETDGNEIIFNLKKINSSKNGNNGTKTIEDGIVLKRQEEETSIFKKPKFIVFTILSVLILSIGIWGLRQNIFKPKPDEKLISIEDINAYLASDSLILDTLKDYKANWAKQSPHINPEDKGLWSSILSSDENTNSAEVLNSWNQTNDSLESAIRKRKLINDKKFAELKKIHFGNQKSFEKTIHDVKKNKYELLKGKLGDISSLGLIEIASKIDSILEPVDSKNMISEKDNDSEAEMAAKAKRNEDIKKKEAAEKSLIQSPEAKGKKKATEAAATNPSLDSSTSKNTSKIINYLQGADITKSQLEIYKAEYSKDKKILKSIELALHLWELEAGNKSCEKYQKELSNNKDLKNNDVLNNIVKEMILKQKSNINWGTFNKSTPLKDLYKKLKEIK